MTRLEILAKAAGTDEKTITDNSDIYWITPEQALEAMKRFGELAYLAGYHRGYGIGYLKESSRIELFYEWLEEQEEK